MYNIIYVIRKKSIPSSGHPAIPLLESASPLRYLGLITAFIFIFWIALLNFIDQTPRIIFHQRFVTEGENKVQ